ncbi:MAG: periplasmic protein TonB [Verrucomicrobiota bacterium]|jgi:TonB family protein
MLRYLLNYFVARTTYDVVRGQVARSAEQRAVINYKNALIRAEAEARANYVPPIDDNMVNSGRRHARLGLSENMVSLCYGDSLGEHERLDAVGAGIRGTVYRVGIFDVGVEFQGGHSVRECWIKNRQSAIENISGGEMLSIMAHKSYGPGWTKLDNSSETRLWYRSEDGLIACCDWSSPIAGGCALTIFDPRAGTPEGLPNFPLPPLLPPALPQPSTGVSTAQGCLIAAAVVICGIVLFGLIGGAVVRLNQSTATDRRNTAPSPIHSATPSEVTPDIIRRAEAVSPTPAPPISSPSAAASPPQITYSPPPTYPAWAKRSGVRGRGRFSIHFGRDGHVIDVRVVQSTGNADLDKAAVNALSTWRAQTGIEGVVTVPVSFGASSR